MKNQDVHNDNTRYRNKLHVSQIITTLARNSPQQYQCVSIFNKMPKMITEEESLTRFNGNLRHFFINEASSVLYDGEYSSKRFKMAVLKMLPFFRFDYGLMAFLTI